MPSHNVRLLAHSPDLLRALRENPGAYKSQVGVEIAEGIREFLGGPEVSESFLARLREATAADPWRDGFGVIHVAQNRLIGLASFNGAPDAEGTVEISYAIAPAHTGRGYATEAARLLIAYATSSGQVRTVRAHTLPEKNASTRVLEKCGFQHRGAVNHLEDGLIWLWELPVPSIGLMS
jgi:[ribosomal protein S5]-alanine N-acetyltransferase